MDNKTGRGIFITLAAIVCIGIVATSYRLANIKGLFNSASRDVLADNETTEDTSSIDDKLIWNMVPNDSLVQNTDIENSGAIKKQPSRVAVNQNISPTQPAASSDSDKGTNNPTDPGDENTDTIATNDLIIGNFEDNTLNGWIGDIGISSPGYSSGYAAQISNVAGESAAIKKIFETPILKGFTHLEFDISSSANEFLPEDASAVAFEQDGAWKWVSLSNYINNNEIGWHHIKLALSDFDGLDTTKTVANLNFRFWNSTANSYYIDNIKLTGKVANTINTPQNFTANVISSSQIDLSWSSDSNIYNIYQDNILISTTGDNLYSVMNLEPETEYNFYITATDGTTESTPTESLHVKTLAKTIPGLLISNFEDGTTGGWGNAETITPGMDSLYALRLVNPINDSVGIEKSFDFAVAKGHSSIEFDINLNGAYLFGEDAQITFDQNGWKTVYLEEYLENGKFDWQHIIIPLSHFADLNNEEGIAKIIFRFWGFEQNTIDLDNISLN